MSFWKTFDDKKILHYWYECKYNGTKIQSSKEIIKFAHYKAKCGLSTQGAYIGKFDLNLKLCTNCKKIICAENGILYDKSHGGMKGADMKGKPKHFLNMKQRFELANWLRSNSMNFTMEESIKKINEDLHMDVSESNLASCAKACGLKFKKKTPKKNAKAFNGGKASHGTSTKILASYIIRMYKEVGMEYGEDLVAVSRGWKIPVEQSIEKAAEEVIPHTH
jgi:transposase